MCNFITRTGEKCKFAKSEPYCHIRIHNPLYKFDDNLPFGQYYGLTLLSVAHMDKRYLKWLSTQDLLKCKYPIIFSKVNELLALNIEKLWKEYEAGVNEKIECPCGSSYIRKDEETHKDRIDHKTGISEAKVTCGCGLVFTHGAQLAHEKTMIHQSWLSNPIAFDMPSVCQCGEVCSQRNKREHSQTAGHKTYMNKIYTCGCGSTTNQYRKSNHIKTKKHQMWLSSQ
jgi:hypothetical protein